MLECIISTFIVLYIYIKCFINIQNKGKTHDWCFEAFDSWDKLHVELRLCPSIEAVTPITTMYPGLLMQNFDCDLY